MVVYKPIYSFEVFDKIKEGELVYMLDRKEQYVACVNEQPSEVAVHAVNTKAEENRYAFWIEQEVKENE